MSNNTQGNMHASHNSNVIHTNTNPSNHHQYYPRHPSQRMQTGQYPQQQQTMVQQQQQTMVQQQQQQQTMVQQTGQYYQQHSTQAQAQAQAQIQQTQYPSQQHHNQQQYPPSQQFVQQHQVPVQSSYAAHPQQAPGQAQLGTHPHQVALNPSNQVQSQQQLHQHVQPPNPQQAFSGQNPQQAAGANLGQHPKQPPVKQEQSTPTIQSPPLVVNLSSRKSSSSRSVMEDEKFAPPPKFSEEYFDLMRSRIASAHEGVKSVLPSLTFVKHSGSLVARTSLKSMITKKWKPCFWVTYGTNQLFCFRSREDFEEWMFNPFLSKQERDGLVKFSLDFVNDVLIENVKGYSVTPICMKDYNNQGMLHHIKIERWLETGPSITAAFASKNQGDVYSLHRLITEMIGKSPQKHRMDDISGYASSGYTSDGGSVRSALSAPDELNRSTHNAYQYGAAPATNSTSGQKGYGKTKLLNTMFKRADSNNNINNYDPNQAMMGQNTAQNNSGSQSRFPSIFTRQGSSRNDKNTSAGNGHNGNFDYMAAQGNNTSGKKSFKFFKRDSSSDSSNNMTQNNSYGYYQHNYDDPNSRSNHAEQMRRARSLEPPKRGRNKKTPQEPIQNWQSNNAYHTGP